MNVFFRVDASLTIGSGHVSRCLTLAHELAAKGARICFICREHEGHLCDLISRSGFVVIRLVARPTTSRRGAVATPHEEWLGGPWEEDARSTAAHIQACGTADWLVVDHYGIDARWEQGVRPYARNLLVIDDLADRAHECNLLLDQNLVDEGASRYSSRVSPTCATLLGPYYALLQPLYRELRSKAAPRQGDVRRILVYFGSGDRFGLRAKTLEALARLDVAGVKVDLVVGTNAAADEAAGALPRALGDRVTIHSRISSLAPLMLAADLSVGATGATTWERLCLGLPTIAITVAPNQRPIAQSLHDRRLLRWLGDADSVNVEAITAELHAVISQGLDPAWSSRCRAVVDGFGATRVCAALTVTTKSQFFVRDAELSDEGLLLAWANDPSTRANSFSPDPISEEAHREWFWRRLREIGRCRIYVVETADRVPIAQVRFERGDMAWEVHYSVASAFRGRRLAPRVLDIALHHFCHDYGNVAIVGRVRTHNEASLRVFRNLGFSEGREAPGIAIFRLGS